jgi:hypothetical protein
MGEFKAAEINGHTHGGKYRKKRKKMKLFQYQL